MPILRKTASETSPSSSEVSKQDLGLYRMLNPEKKVYFDLPLNENDMAMFSDGSIEEGPGMGRDFRKMLSKGFKLPSGGQ